VLAVPGSSSRSRAPRPPSRRLGLQASTFLLLALLMVAGPGASAQGADPDLPKRSERLGPALRFVTTELTFSIALPDPAFNEGEMFAVIGPRVARGEITSERQAVAAAVRELARNPSRYLRPTRTKTTEKGRIIGTGPGVVVHPDGYVVANAHLVAPSDEAVEAYIRNLLFGVYYEDILAGLRAEVGDDLTAAQTKQLLDGLTRWAGDHLEVADVKMRHTVSRVVRSADGTEKTKELPAELAAAGEQVPAEDVAVLKIEDSKNLVTAPVGQEDQLRAGDQLYAMTIPGTSTFVALDLDDPRPELRPPHAVQGRYQDAKTSDSGTLIQADLALSGADSGGPVFDAAGKVIGFTSLHAIDEKTGKEGTDEKGVVPASEIRGLLERVNLQPVESPATQKLNQALELVDKRWYKRALPLLQEVEALDPGHGLVRRHLNESQAAIAAGRDETPVEVLGLPLLVFVGLAGLAALLLLGALIMLALTLRRRRRRTPPPPPGGPPVGSPPAPGGWAAAPGGPPAPGGWAAPPPPAGPPVGSPPAPGGWAAPEVSSPAAAPVDGQPAPTEDDPGTR
jgi:serine protease Do